jgi:hypothetical protein
MASALVERYDDRIAGVLSCYDRVVVTGTLGVSDFLCVRRLQSHPPIGRMTVSVA